MRFCGVAYAAESIRNRHSPRACTRSVSRIAKTRFYNRIQQAFAFRIAAFDPCGEICRRIVIRHVADRSGHRSRIDGVGYMEKNQVSGFGRVFRNDGHAIELCQRFNKIGTERSLRKGDVVPAESRHGQKPLNISVGIVYLIQAFDDSHIIL